MDIKIGIGARIKAIPVGSRTYVVGNYTTIRNKPAISVIELVIGKGGLGKKDTNKLVNKLIKPETIKVEFPFKDATGRVLYSGDAIYYKGKDKVYKGCIAYGDWANGGESGTGHHIEWEDKTLSSRWKNWLDKKAKIFYGLPPKNKK